MTDYAHDPAGHQALMHYLPRGDFRRRIAVMNAVRDRRDEDIMAIGQTVTAACQHVILYEDADYLRGRTRGETITLLQQGLGGAWTIISGCNTR